MKTIIKCEFLSKSFKIDSLTSTVTVGLLVIQATTQAFTFNLLSICVPTGVLSSHLAPLIISFSDFINSSLLEGRSPGISNSCAAETKENNNIIPKRAREEDFIAE